jgi:hypothetical protein
VTIEWIRKDVQWLGENLEWGNLGRLSFDHRPHLLDLALLVESIGHPLEADPLSIMIVLHALLHCVAIVEGETTRDAVVYHEEVVYAEAQGGEMYQGLGDQVSVLLDGHGDAVPGDSGLHVGREGGAGDRARVQKGNVSAIVCF